MSVRIIAGEWKGRRLQTPPGKHTRPLLDRIKQSLFDYLGQRLDGLTVVDVCAGSGSFGFEAASRGAQSVHFIENDAEALKCLHQNKDMLETSLCTIHGQAFQTVLPKMHEIDLIYADPPFPWYQQDPQQVAALLDACFSSLAQDGRFLIRGDKGQELPNCSSNYTIHSRKSYGRSWILDLRKTH